MPLIIWSSFSVNIFSGVFINLMTRAMKATHPEWALESEKYNYTALFTMTLLGAGEIIGG